MPRAWTVVGHDPILTLEDNLWAVDGEVPGLPLRRRMTILRLPDGRLALHNAIPLEEKEQARLESFGTPAFLVVPNGFHRLDFHAYKQRYPSLKVLAPAQAAHRAKVAAVVPVDGALGDLPGVRVEALEGSKLESVLIAESDGRLSLIVGDTIMNNPDRLPGWKGALFGLIGSTGGAKVTPLARLALVADRKKLRAHLERLAALPGLRRIVPSHGAIIDVGAGEVLRRVAAAL